MHSTPLTWLPEFPPKEIHYQFGVYAMAGTSCAMLRRSGEPDIAGITLSGKLLGEIRRA